MRLLGVLACVLLASACGPGGRSTSVDHLGLLSGDSPNGLFSGTTGGNPPILSEGYDRNPWAALRYLGMCMSHDIAFGKKPFARDPESDSVDKAAPLEKAPRIVLQAQRMVILVNDLDAGDAYQWLQLKLSKNDDCGPALAVQNAAGTFASNDDLTLTFLGDFVVPESSQLEIRLDIGSFVQALGQIKSDGEIKTAVKGTAGSIPWIQPSSGQ